MSIVKSWNIVEARKAATGTYPLAASQEDKVYLTWIRDCDARMGHALLFNNSEINDFIKIRALFFRGQFEEAGGIIKRIAETSDNAHDVIESLLENARLAAFEGDWLLCHALSAEALASPDLESLSYLSALQVHALSCFELGEFARALKALDKAESLQSLYPFSISAHYANVLRARLSSGWRG